MSAVSWSIVCGATDKVAHKREAGTAVTALMTKCDTTEKKDNRTFDAQ